MDSGLDYYRGMVLVVFSWKKEIKLRMYSE